MISKAMLLEVLNLNLPNETSFLQLGISNTNRPGSLSFFDDDRYLSELNQNDNITGTFVSSENAKKIIGKQVIITEDPRWAYYTIQNHIGKLGKKSTPSSIHPTSFVHKTAWVAENNVIIGRNCKIGANVTILEDVEIGDDCVIQPGTVIGSEGFEFKRTKKGVLSVYHDGKVIIGNKVEIGSNTCIDKGFSFINTIVENEVRIDNLVHVAHGVHIKEGAFVIAAAMLAGSCIIGKNSWIGPNATIGHVEIGDDGNVTFGSVVTKNVEPGQKVTGNFAMPHDMFLKNLKKVLKGLNE